MDKIKSIQIITVLFYTILIGGLIYFDTLQLWEGKEEVDDYIELWITSVSFLVVYMYGSRRGGRYLYKTLEKLKIHPDLFLPGIFFVAIEFFVFMGVFLLLIYSIMIGFELLYVLIVIGVYCIILFMLFSFIHNYFRTLSFGTEIVMYKQWEKGIDPKFFESAKKVVRDKKTFYIALEFVGFYYVARILKRISKVLSHIYSGMIIHPLQFLTLHQAYYEDRGAIESTSNAFSTLRKRFTESVYGTETSSMASMLVLFSIFFLNFSTRIIFPAYGDPGIIELVANKRFFDVTLIFLYWISVFLGSLIIHSLVRSVAPLYFVFLSKSTKKVEKSEIVEFFKRARKLSKWSPLLFKYRIVGEQITEENFLKAIDIGEDKIKKFREKSPIRRITRI